MGVHITIVFYRLNDDKLGDNPPNLGDFGHSNRVEMRLLDRDRSFISSAPCTSI